MPQHRKLEPKKYCQYCKARLRRKIYNSVLEDNGAFSRRKYCDRKCMALGMEKGEVSKHAYHWRARKLRKPACEICGNDRRGKTGLHVHHRDGDWKNNTAENVVTLCSSCHLKTHWAEGRTHGLKRRMVVEESLESLLDLARRAAEHLRVLPLSGELMGAIEKMKWTK